ncbi:hypothetical protein VDGL01_12353 [Verticillium dahliae]
MALVLAHHHQHIIPSSYTCVHESSAPHSATTAAAMTAPPAGTAGRTCGAGERRDWQRVLQARLTTACESGGSRLSDAAPQWLGPVSTTTLADALASVGVPSAARCTISERETAERVLGMRQDSYISGGAGSWRNGCEAKKHSAGAVEAVGVISLVPPCRTMGSKGGFRRPSKIALVIGTCDELEEEIVDLKQKACVEPLPEKFSLSPKATAANPVAKSKGVRLRRPLECDWRMMPCKTVLMSNMSVTWNGDQKERRRPASEGQRRYQYLPNAIRNNCSRTLHLPNGQMNAVGELGDLALHRLGEQVCRHQGCIALRVTLRDAVVPASQKVGEARMSWRN